MHSTISIDVAAPPETVFRIAHRVDSWDRLLPHYARSRVVDRRSNGALVVDFVARLSLVPFLGLGLPVTWRSLTWNEPETLRLRFLHLAGATRGMDVTWRIDGTSTGSRISIDHEFRPRIPGFAAFVDRWFTRAIAGRTLATFKALAEALEGALADPAGHRESDRRPETNPVS